MAYVDDLEKFTDEAGGWTVVDIGLNQVKEEVLKIQKQFSIKAIN